MGKFMDFMDAAAYIMYGVDTKAERQKRNARRGRPIGKSAYGQNTRSGAYGRGTYSFDEGTYDGLPAIGRHRDGVYEVFYQAGAVDIDDENHGHVIMASEGGEVIYHRRPNESTPIVDKRKTKG
ncbi:MAG TPA: hypothetical protein VJ841_02995 [Candidatus Saccharimonadales bacterium]|nr:hypothetical protein [Candidatus Saccharimonadales bacterium]